MTEWHVTGTNHKDAKKKCKNHFLSTTSLLLLLWRARLEGTWVSTRVSDDTLLLIGAPGGQNPVKEKMGLRGVGGWEKGNPGPDYSQEMKVKSHVFLAAWYLKWLRGYQGDGWRGREREIERQTGRRQTWEIKGGTPTPKQWFPFSKAGSGHCCFTVSWLKLYFTFHGWDDAASPVEKLCWPVLDINSGNTVITNKGWDHLKTSKIYKTVFIDFIHRLQ